MKAAGEERTTQWTRRHSLALMSSYITPDPSLPVPPDAGESCILVSCVGELFCQFLNRDIDARLQGSADANGEGPETSLFNRDTAIILLGIIGDL